MDELCDVKPVVTGAGDEFDLALQAIDDASAAIIRVLLDSWPQRLTHQQVAFRSKFVAGPTGIHFRVSRKLVGKRIQALVAGGLVDDSCRLSATNAGEAILALYDAGLQKRHKNGTPIRLPGAK